MMMMIMTDWDGWMGLKNNAHNIDSPPLSPTHWAQCVYRYAWEMGTFSYRPQQFNNITRISIEHFVWWPSRCRCGPWGCHVSTGTSIRTFCRLQSMPAAGSTWGVSFQEQIDFYQTKVTEFSFFSRTHFSQAHTPWVQIESLFTILH